MRLRRDCGSVLAAEPKR
jgi:PhnB protein